MPYVYTKQGLVNEEGCRGHGFGVEARRTRRDAKAEKGRGWAILAVFLAQRRDNYFFVRAGPDVGKRLITNFCIRISDLRGVL
jgi:hypothetical protein